MPHIPHLRTDDRAIELIQSGMSTIHNILSTAVESSDASLLDQNSLTMRSLGGYNSINTTAIYAANQQRVRQIVATTTSCISLSAALVAVYWFFMMRRNFRRDLVLLLILGGAWKSLWFVIFCVYTFAHGTVLTETVFCQASGYLMQVGFEFCDVAVLFMSMHMYLQIFPTARFGLGNDGLYRVRGWVYATWIILPNLSGALAFVNPHPAFMAQGGFCSLPLRPIWYRIALFWGPRYIIWAYVVFVAVRIYRYVGSEFKVFGQERDRSSSLGVPGNSSVDRMMRTEFDMKQEKRQVKRMSSMGGESECAPNDWSGISIVRANTDSSTDLPEAGNFNAARRQSTPSWIGGFAPGSEDVAMALPPTVRFPGSRRGSYQIGNNVTAEDFAPPSRFERSGHRGSITSLASKQSSIAATLDGGIGLSPIKEGSLAMPFSTEDTRPTASGAIKLRRRLIQRQLRLLFIYPCIYMLLWIIPMVVNVMNYTDYFAQNPIFWIGILNLVCVTFMTSADVTVFCWRERPWRHIPGSDGTFLGSFMFWRICWGDAWVQDRRMSRAPSRVPSEKELDGEKFESRTGLMNTFKSWKMQRNRSSPRGSESTDGGAKRSMPTHKRTFSGGSDRKQMEAQMAQERLALERADYEQNRLSYQERRSSVVSQQQQQYPDRKEWFDRQMDGDLFEDQELDVNEKTLEA